ncbi:hypothetical protein ANCCEY_01763 [Ancylostoma ceylanicum]|uniref:Reverse transcriptase domain-containing protein n=1 Tax=Ancylostoma ceylanicum TaxID=53326 RepID=A0A0D6M4P8_9BILA|nr:hypothetical protein ANCCEY_01763 [Ancylostoma ceylanicum]
MCAVRRCRGGSVLEEGKVGAKFVNGFLASYYLLKQFVAIFCCFSSDFDIELQRVILHIKDNLHARTLVNLAPVRSSEQRTAGVKGAWEKRARKESGTKAKKGSTALEMRREPLPLQVGVTRAVANRIEVKLEEVESPSQVGFRRKHSTLNHVHLLKQSADKSKEYNFPDYVALVDNKKAFDSLEWNALWTALGRRGIHPELIEMLRKLYESSSTSVLVNSHQVPVTIRRGIKQGDTMSPKLFNVILQMVQSLKI